MVDTRSGSGSRVDRLFTEGDLPEGLLEAERTELSKQRTTLEAERSRLESPRSPALDLKLIERQLPDVVDQIRKWVLNAGTDDLSLMLRALDVQMVASPEQVQIRGAVPVLDFADDLATTERTSACSFDSDKPENVSFRQRIGRRN